MLIDAHTHLQPHGERPLVDRARLELYVESALAHGLHGLVITEHIFRFNEALERLYGWWEAERDPRLAAAVRAYWEDHANLSLPEYVALIEAAKSDGLPVYLGVEMDWLPGRADDLRALLAPYAWDVVLGSVHWIGGFGFDDDRMLDEWARRDVDDVYASYGRLIGELADSDLADVLAHPDLPKLFGHTPSDPDRLHRQIVAAARRNGLAIEINSNGLNQPIAELYPAPPVLEAACKVGVPVTLASDAHRPARLGEGFDLAIAAARTAGYDGYARFERRQRIHTGF